MKQKEHFFLKKRVSSINNFVIVLLITIIFVFPLWFAFNNAFKEVKYIYKNPLILTPSSFTVNNVIKVFKLMNYPRTFLNSTIILIISCSFLIILGSLAGFGIGIANTKLLNRVYGFIVASMALPFQLAMVPLIVMIKRMGLINNYFGLALVYAGLGLPFLVFLYTGFIRTIPKEIEESAWMDGCSLFQIYFRIYFPLLKPITGTVLILRGVGVWNDLLIPLLVITKGSMVTLPLKLMSFLDAYKTHWEYIFAGTLLVSLPIIIVFIALQRFIIKGVVEGSVKG